jgi:hypothetical protein
VNKRRLLRLADLLEANAKNEKGVKFDLDSWAKLPPGKVTLDCRTTACAVGLACISGEFEELTYRRGLLTPSKLIPLFRELIGWDAVERFFGLNEDRAYRLFNDKFYPPEKRKGAKGERAVAYRIRRMVAAG